MKIAIISDIHGHIYALEKFFSVIKKIDIDQIYFLGDAVGYLPHGYKCVQLLKSKNVICIKGNHEEMLIKEREIDPKSADIYKFNLTQQDFSENDINEIKNWSKSLELNIDNKNLLMVHASPFDLTNGYIYPTTPLDDFEDLTHDYILMGHTHRPFIRAINDKKIINVGSIGMPRDMGSFGSFGIIDLQKNEVSIKRFDITKENENYNNHENVHESVKQLFKRNENNYVGTLI